jgi:hypothetical protein
MLDIDESRRICDAATPGPWEWSGDDLMSSSTCIATTGCDCGLSVTPVEDDKRFSAHARTALPAALDEIERLRRQNERLKAALRD